MSKRKKRRYNKNLRRDYAQRLSDRHYYNVLRENNRPGRPGDYPGRFGLKNQRLTRKKKWFNKIVQNKSSQTTVKIKDYSLQNVLFQSNLIRKEKICRERSERRRSLFRIGRAGKGVAGPIKKVIDPIKSKVRCK